jgi:hypothetical protein
MKRTTQKKNIYLHSKKNRTHRVKAGTLLARTVTRPSMKTSIKDTLKKIGSPVKDILGECAKENLKKGAENVCKNMGKTKGKFNPSFLYNQEHLKRVNTPNKRFVHSPISTKKFTIDFSKIPKTVTTPSKSYSKHGTHTPPSIKKIHFKSKKEKEPVDMMHLINTAHVNKKLSYKQKKETPKDEQ